MPLDDHDPGAPSTHSELLKVEYAPVMQAIHRAMKRFCTPGVQSGIAELAELLGRNANAMRHQFGPTCYDHAPTVHAFLLVIETLQSREAVAEIAALADCVTLPRSPSAKAVGAPADDAGAFALLFTMFEQRLQPTLSQLNTGRPLSVAERATAREALHHVAAYIAHLLTRVR